jgi:hypothetical protein
MVHLRNALQLHRELGFELVECEDDAHKLAETDWDNIIVSYASFYVPWRAYFDHVMRSRARLWWLVNDHDIEDSMLLRAVLHETAGRRRYSVISNNTRAGYRQWILRKWIFRDRLRLGDCIEDWHTVNLNALTYEDQRSADPVALELFHMPAIYWGSWRKWRLPYFEKYSDPRISFSTSGKNARKLHRLGCRYNFIPKLLWGRSSQLHFANATIYIEDPHTHSNYAFPANRFYEAISYGVDVYFDPTCRLTADRIGGATFVDGPAELVDLARERRQDQTIWRFQAAADRAGALEQIRGLMEGP